MSIRQRVAGGMLLVLLLLSATLAHAAARASLQPDRISLGNTATLTITTDELNVAPDFSALDKDFIVRNQSSSVQTSIVNGSYSAQTSYSVELEPRAEGVLTVPPITIGNSVTEALTLTVVPAQQGSAARGDPIYIESEIETTTPYVQQAVVYTVRLFYAMPLLGGDVSAPAPANASLQQLGEDRQGQVEIGGQRYGVFERRYLLIPEQSGTLELPAARFRGNAQSTGGNGFFSRSEPVSAIGQAFTLNVRPQPANAPQPWLAARALSLTRAELPPSPRAGEPLLVDITLSADGATSTQLADLELPPIAAAQVFPEAPQRQDRVVSGQSLATLRRRFAIVPSAAGTLELPEIRVPFWNVEQDRADVAILPALRIEIAAGAATAGAPAAVATAAVPVAAPVPIDPQSARALRAWQAASAVLALGLLAALAWGWRRGRAAAAAALAATPTAATAPDPVALRRALARGDLQEIGDALRQSTAPASLNLGAVVERLADDEQRAATRELERVLWAPHAGADAHAAVRARLQSAFRQGPRWRGAAARATAPGVLPALYPRV